MPEYISGTFLIVDYRKYPEDIVFRAISPYEGQHSLIVKGNRYNRVKNALPLDIGNLIKAKIYVRHHWYVSEADTIQSFAGIKSNLPSIALYQALLMTLKCTYYLPEFKLFASVIKVLEELNKGTADKQELGITFTILKILDYYQLLLYPFRCKLCDQKLFSGYFYKESYYCLEHGERLSEEYRTLFALTTEIGRVKSISFLLKELLNINFNYPAPRKDKEKNEEQHEVNN